MVQTKLRIEPHIGVWALKEFGLGFLKLNLTV